MGVNVFGRTETEQFLQSLYFRSALSPVEVDYRRSLFLNDAIPRTEYTYNGAKFTREHFVSYLEDETIYISYKNGKLLIDKRD